MIIPPGGTTSDFFPRPAISDAMHKPVEELPATALKGDRGRPGEHLHIRALDGVRGLAILLVVVGHSTVIHPSTFLARTLSSVTSIGWSGVDLFFVLSGFLITRILLQSKGKSNYFRVFYIRRCLRIFPLYYVVVFCALFLVPTWFAVPAEAYRYQAWLWTFSSNWILAFNGAALGGLGMTWSLAIEEQFYVFWPVLVRRFDERTLIRACFFIQIIAILSRIAIVYSSESVTAAYNITFCRLDAISLGALVALYHNGQERKVKWNKLVKCMLPACSLLLVLVIATTGNASAFTIPMQTVGFTAVAWIWAAMLSWTLQAPSSRAAVRLFESRFLVMLGTLSYGIYLLHGAVLYVAWNHLFQGTLGRGTQSDLIGQVLFFAIVLGGSIGVAYISQRLFEGPILGLKRRFPYR